MNRIGWKLLLNGIIVIPLLLWFTEATVWNSIVTAVIFCLIAYIIGDQIILRASNNMVATAADAALAFVYFWLVADWMNWSLTWGELLVMVVALGVVEFIFHRLLGEADGRRRVRA